MTVEIPLSELLKEDPKTVDVLYMLDHVASWPTPFITMKNGELVAERRGEDIILNSPLAKEIAKIAIAYRQFFRVMQIHQKAVDLDYKQWLRFYHEAFIRCMELDKVESGK
jgi:hypothetical protein